MKMRIPLFIILFVGLASALTPVNSCMDLNTANEVYVLTADLTGNMADGRCLDVDANNITVDCNGHSITGNVSGTTYGVRVSGDNYVKVENCNITNYRYGIYFRSVHDGLMYNNTVQDCVYGIYMGYSNCYNNTIQGNRVSDCTSYGIRTTGSPYSNLIYDNYLSFNADNAYDSSGGNNFWNTSYNCTAGPSITGGNCIGGNYYNDYFGVDDGSGVYPHNISGDGIGDNPPYYTVHGSVRDDLPLTSNYTNYRNITACTDITAAGEYRLSADLVGNQSNGACIRITSDHVTFNCQNRKITGDSAGTTYGIYVSGDDYAIVKNCEISDYRYGIYYRSVYSGTIEDNIIDSCDYGTYLGYSGCGRNVVEGNEISRSSVQGIRLLSGASLSNITNNEIRDGTGIGIYIGASNIILGSNTIYGHSGYALMLNNTPNMMATGTSIYNQTQYLYVSGATNNLADLTLGYDERTGLINYPNLVLTSVNITDANLILARDFVSLNASDPNAAEMNDTANITLYIPGCGGIKYYVLDGFPTTRNEIVTNGTNFTPAFSQCIGTLATFEVPSFSGYAADGMAPPSGGKGKERKILTVSAETICPGDTVEFTITHGGGAVSDAEIQLALYDPYVGLIATKYTDENGKAQFTIPGDAIYRVRIKKDSYYYSNPYVIDYTMCAEGVPPEEEEPAEQPPAEELEEAVQSEEEEVPEEPEMTPEAEEEVPEVTEEEVPEVPGAESEEPQPEEEGPPWMLLLGIIVVIGGIAALSYWFLTQRGTGRRR